MSCDTVAGIVAVIAARGGHHTQVQPEEACAALILRNARIASLIATRSLQALLYRVTAGLAFCGQL